MKAYPVVKSGPIKGTYYQAGTSVKLNPIDAQTYESQGLIAKSIKQQKPATAKAAK